MLIDLDVNSINNEGTVQYVSFNNDHNPMELVYVCFHHGADLKGFDDRYNFGSHSSKYFCVYCQSVHKYDYTKSGTSYRTTASLQNDADKHQKATNDRIKLPSHQSALQFSKGVKGIPPDPHPGASRITLALLHMDMGMMTALLQIHTNHVKTITDHSITNLRFDSLTYKIKTAITNLNSMYSDIDKRNKIKQNMNRHYNELEGKQAKKYRINFASIAEDLSPSQFYILINRLFELFNKTCV